MFIPMVRASAFAPFVAHLNNIDPGLLASSPPPRLAPTIVDDPDALVPLEPAMKQISDCAQKLSCADLGLRIGQSLRVDQLGTYGLIIARSRTLAEAVEAASAALPKMNSGADMHVSRKGTMVWLRHRLGGKDRPGSAHAQQFTLALLVDLVRMAAGRSWMPSRALLPPQACQAVGEDSPYRPILDETRLNESAIAFDGGLLDLPVVSPAAIGNGQEKAFSEQVARFLASAPSREFLHSLEQCLVPLMKSKQASVEQVAAVSGYSVRTLQRRLDEEGVSFSETLERTRRREACRLLENSSLKVIDIGYELGYAEPASFTRAFSRWTGRPPQRWRLERRALLR